MTMTSQTTSNVEIKLALCDERTDRCEHVEGGDALPYILFKEDDGSGPLVRNVLCRACYTNHKEKEKTQFAPCEKCTKNTPYSELSQWRPYDGGPGDERDLCNECRAKAQRSERAALASELEARLSRTTDVEDEDD